MLTQPLQAKHAHQVAVGRAEEVGALRNKPGAQDSTCLLQEMEQMAADLMRAEERAKVAEMEKAEDAARHKDEVPSHTAPRSAWRSNLVAVA